MLYCTLLQHVTNEGTALVKQAEDAASNKKVQHFFLHSIIDFCASSVFLRAY